MRDSAPTTVPGTAALQPSAWRIVLAVAAAFAAVGVLALQLAVPPTYASPVFPSTGIALAATLVYGRPALLGTFLGSALLNAGYRVVTGDATPTTTLVACITGVGTALQAWCGATLLRYSLRPPFALDTPADFLRLTVFGAALPCLISATIAVTTFVAFGSVAPSAWFATWWVWWSGDAIGAVIGLPVTLCLIGRPRAVWAVRRFTVALPLALATLVVGLAIATIARLESSRIDAAFRQDAVHLANSLEQRLTTYSAALHATHGLFVASDDVTPQEFRIAAAYWLRSLPGLRAIGYSSLIGASEVAAFENTMHARGYADFKVFDRGDKGTRLPAATSGDLMVITYIEPLDSNRLALGVNTLSIPQPRAAILAALESGEPVATGGFQLTQDRDAQLGVVVYRALGNDPALPAARRGVVFVTMRMTQLLETLARDTVDGLALCVHDLTPGAPHLRLAGPAQCDVAGSVQLFAKPLAFAGRQWQVRIAAAPAYFVQRRSWAAWSFSVAGVMTIALLGAYLLVASGRARRTEAIVAQRTAELRHEIGERRATETALRASEERFRTVFDAAPVGLSIAALDGRFVRANPHYCAMVGRSLEELLKLRISDITLPDDHPADRRAHATLLAGQTRVVTVQKRYLRPDGSVVPAEVVVTIERDALGAPRTLIGVASDISERLRLLDARQAQRVAEASSRAKTEFLSRMSHELRTPLNAILGFAQLVEMDAQATLPETQLGRVRQIQASGWHLLEMINDVLDLSLIESGGLRLASETIDLTAIVRETVAMLEPAAARRGIAVTMALDAQLPPGRGDATRLRQVLVNLLSNAVKYNREHGSVRVVTSVEGNLIAVRVTDTGVGFTAEQLEQLFQPFNRLGREHGKVEGTGIGLVISRRLAELMGGSLTVESHGHTGTTFVCSIPRATPVAVAPPSEEQTMTAAAHPDGIPAETPPARVLYIEDNATNAEVMRGFLRLRPGVTLELCTTVKAGLAALHERPPAMLLLDMNLPDGTGLDVLRAVRAHPALASLPVIVVSADAMSAQVDAALAAGADSYLPKPLRMAEVLSHVDDALRLSRLRTGDGRAAPSIAASDNLG